MEFGPRPVRDAAGALLAHSVNFGKRRLRKGHRLDAGDVAALAAAGIESVIVAALGAGEIPENDAAAELARALATPMLRAGIAGTGRCNLYPDRPGLLVIDAEAVHRFNAVDEGITLATLPPFEQVAARQIAATVKIIPFAAPAAAVARCAQIARESGALRLAPFRPLRVGLVQTTLPGLKPELLDKTIAVTRARLAGIGSVLVATAACAHRAEAVQAALDSEMATRRCDVVLVLGASAIVDRRDVIPRAIAALGGTIVHFGMPVDPGNLTLLARIGPVHVLGLPGSARSPRLHGSDYVLHRIAAGLEVTATDIARMGVGGLLKEGAARPLPRARAAPAPHLVPRRISGIVLAAGRSSRMQGPNKLLAEIGGTPLVRRVAEAAIAAIRADVVVVTGHDHARVEAALAGLPVRFVHNPNFAQGMSTSLKAGIRACGDEIEGAVVMLGDMPETAPALIEGLVAAFDPAARRDLVVPVRGGRRGNPVLIGSRHFPAIARLEGDVGARDILQANAAAIVEIPVGDDAAFLDLDTPEALAAYRARAARAITASAADCDPGGEACP